MYSGEIILLRILGLILMVPGIAHIFKAIYYITSDIDSVSEGGSGYICERMQCVICLAMGLYYFSVGFLMSLSMISGKYVFYYTIPVLIFDRAEILKKIRP